jgi:hypothetical protein
LTVAPLVNFNRLTNSNAKDVSSNLNVLSPGVQGEAFFENLADGYLQLYVNDRLNVNSTFEGETSSWSNTFQIAPVYWPLYIDRPIPIWYTFRTVVPTFTVQYFDRLNGASEPIFASSNRVFRYGPGVTVWMRFFDAAPVPDWLQKFSGSVSFDWYQDTISNRKYQHLLAMLTYNITKNYGVTASYEDGEVEETGARIEITKVGLSVTY